MSSDIKSSSACLSTLILHRGSGSDQRGKTKSKNSSPKEKAQVKSLAHDNITTQNSSSSKEECILDRIRKCLDRGNHPTTPEAEARTSLLMAAKLMAQHNIQEAELSAKSDTMHNSIPQPGESIVSITRLDGKRPTRQTFAGRLGVAITIFFSCNAYTNKRETSIEYIFYGLACNTAAAAMAFEMVYNLISYWALKKKGNSTKFSYAVGVAEGLVHLAKREKTTWKANANHSGTELCINTERMQEEYLKKRKMKIVAGRRGTEAKDLSAWEEGVKDSEKIDVRQKRLK